MVYKGCYVGFLVLKDAGGVHSYLESSALLLAYFRNAQCGNRRVHAKYLVLQSLLKIFMGAHKDLMPVVLGVMCHVKYGSARALIGKF